MEVKELKVYEEKTMVIINKETEFLRQINRSLNTLERLLTGKETYALLRNLIK